MTNTCNPFAQTASEVLQQFSGMLPEFTQLFYQYVLHHYETHTIATFKDYSQAVEALYAMDDSQYYVLCSFLSVNEEREVIALISYEHLIDNIVCKQTIGQLRDKGLLVGKELHTFGIAMNSLFAILVSTLRERTLTKRKAVITRAKTVELPNEIELKRFYECGRKVIYKENDCTLIELHEGNSYYKCKHCPHYHQGRPPLPKTANYIRLHEADLRRWTTAWRRHYKL